MNGITAFFQDSTLSSIFITIFVYVLAVKLQKLAKLPVFNSILVSVILIITFLKLTGIPNRDYQDGAKYITILLTPATVSFGLWLYEQMQVLKKNLWAILPGILAGTLISLISVILMTRVFNLNRELTASLLPKSITLAMGVPLSEEAGGIGAVTAASIIMTGILGSIFGKSLRKILGLKHPIAGGTAIGTSTHVIGTAKAAEESELLGAVGSLSLVVAGLITAFIYPLILSLK